MTDTVVKALDLPARTGTIYPKVFAAELKGREKRALGDQFGLTQIGVNLTTLEPGAWSAQRHWHEREDEFVYVLEGEIVLVDDAGEHVMSAGMCAGFRAGSGNGHQLVNRSARRASYLEVGTRQDAERVHYPDIDMQAAKVGGKWVLTRKDGTGF